MIKRIAIWLAVLTVLGAGVGYGLWYLPASQPEEVSLRQKEKKAQRPAAYVEYMAFEAAQRCDLLKPEEKRDCVANKTRNDIDRRLLYLLLPHKIADEDCQWMARILKDKVGLKDDEAIYVNYQGRSNCDFSKYGLAHIGEDDRYENWGIVPSGKSFKEEYGVSDEAGVFALRNIYVTQPVYSLFRTRMKIEYGAMGEGRSGSVCYFNRFSGDWRQEGECQLVSVS